MSKKPLRRYVIGTKPVSLTPIGAMVQATGTIAANMVGMSRLFAHAGMVGVVGAIVLTGSTSHSARLNPLADQTGFGSVLDKAAAMDVAAKVATQANMLVTQDVNVSAKNLNAQVSLATADDGSLAMRQVVDTAGAASTGIINHKVKTGDTISSVAAQYNITSDTLRWANNLSGDEMLKPGQALVVLPISGLQHTVAAGESAQSLAEKYQSNADQIVAFNNAEVKGIKTGDSVIIPDGVMPQAPRPTVAAAATAPAGASRNASAAVASSAPVRPSAGSSSNSYSYGYCTWYVASRRAVPGSWGNANTWYGNAQAAGYAVGSVPRPGAIAWTGAGYYGHVAYVESVNGNMVTVSEMNYNGNWGRATFRTTSASSFRYIY